MTQQCENCQREQLKSTGLLERISRLTSQYEDEVAGLRVELTLLVNRVQQQQQESSVLELSEGELEDDDPA